MKHRYIVFKSPSFYDLDTLEYVKSRVCTQHEIVRELEKLNENAENCYYWYQRDEQYKSTEE